MKFVMAVLLLGVRLWAAPPGAGQEFQPILPSELQMTSEPLAPGAPAIILERRVDRDDRGGSNFENSYLRIKILTEEGRKYANVELPFYSGIDSISNLKARTIRPNGSVVDFGGTIYEKSLVKGRNLKVQVKAFTFPDVQVGSILEYFYTEKLKGLFDSHWNLNSNLFTKRAEFSLRPSPDPFGITRLHWILKRMPSGVQPHNDRDHVIRLEVSNIAAFEEEDFMPPESELRASVDFIYEYAFRGDSAKFWKETGKEWNDALELFLKKHKAIDEAAGQMFSPADSPEQKLRKMYSRVQSLRNTSYEIQRTAKEEKRNKEKPAENVDDIWKHGYGDAVELAWLFLGLARAAGFEAHGCWVANRSERFFNPSLVHAEALNANIVLVKMKDRDLYLDPGMPFAPFGLLPWYETATPGLRLDNDGGTLFRLPLPRSDVSQVQRSARFKLAESGDLVGKVTMTFTGLDAMYGRSQERNEDDVARKLHLEELLKAQIPVATEVELTKGADWNSAETPLQAEFSVKIPNWASSTGRRLLLPVGIFSKPEKTMFVSSERIHPIYFTYPYSERDDVTIELPPTWQALSMPQVQKQEGNGVVYSITVEASKGALQVKRDLNIDIFVLEQSEYPGLHKFFQSVRSGDEQQIVLQPPVAREQTGGIRFDPTPQCQLGFLSDFDSSPFYSRTSFAYFPNPF